MLQIPTFALALLIGIGIKGSIASTVPNVNDPVNITPIMQGENGPDAATQERILGRSLLSAGDTARLERLFARAKRGEKLTIGVIGGSITAGAAASKEENRYGNRIAAWWRKQFPGAQIEFVNAGIGATGSNYGAMRAERDLLSHHPDFVVVEYAVNDPDIKPFAITLEGLVRQILRQPQRPAVVMVFMMTTDGNNAQQWHSKVGEHYGIPMISYRDALFPEISAGQLARPYVFADQVHPNDHGHAYVAEFVTHYLEGVLSRSGTGKPAAIKAIPAPLFSNLYEHTSLYFGMDLQPTSNSGWTFDTGGGFWFSDTPGSVFEAEVEGQEVNLLGFRIKGPMGRAKVQVDAEPPVILEGWFDQTWGGYTFTEVVGHDLKPGKHHVRVEIVPEKADGSTGHGFRIYGLGTAGTKTKR